MIRAVSSSKYVCNKAELELLGLVLSSGIGRKHKRGVTQCAKGRLREFDSARHNNSDQLPSGSCYTCDDPCEAKSEMSGTWYIRRRLLMTSVCTPHYSL
jgi:hypothetical protein